MDGILISHVISNVYTENIQIIIQAMHIQLATLLMIS